MAEAIDVYRAAAQQDDIVGRPPREETRRLNAHVVELSDAFTAGLRELEHYIGVPEEVFDDIAAARRPPRVERYWRSDIESTPADGNIDEMADAGLERLRADVDPAWLESEAKKEFRLDEDIFDEPLQLVGSVRVGVNAERPQRLAHMLLVTDDHLKKHDRLDFFAAPMMVAEVAALGTRIDEIPALGPEAFEKLRLLPQMTDSDVAATVYELLVGTAARRKGLDVTMLPRAKSGRTPDFSIEGLSVPAAIECKRRLGLLSYELAEAARLRDLYEAVRADLARAHVRVDVTFVDEIHTVDIGDFRTTLMPLLDGRVDRRIVTTRWGEIAVETLPYTQRIERTRAFSPDFMAAIFDWQPNDAWDGILCEVESEASVVVQRARCPRAIRWVSRSVRAMEKKARGITSQWGDAMKQIPGGKMGFVFIAYPEVNRAEIADARTREIMDASTSWDPRWSIAVGTTVINRLYPRALGCGNPDFIESAMPLAPHGDEFFADLVPSCVFTPPPQGRSADDAAEAKAKAVAMLIERARRGK